MTYPEWIALLAATPENAKRSEAWAVGKQHGEPVSSTDETYNNNAKYYADQSKIWADGSDLDGISVQPEDNATFWANEAHGWTNNKEGTVHDYSATNNSKYWAEQSKEFVDGKDLDGNSVAVRAKDNASYYKDQAKLWANNGMDGEVPSAVNNAKAYATDAKENNRQAESWTKGTRAGQPDTIRQNAATDNASYYNEQSKLWANFGTEGSTPTATNNAKAYSEVSDENRQQAESWAVGTRDGSADTVRPNAATNNAKYYSDNADASAQASEESNLQSESWATGNRNGTPDSERQGAVTDNSKYYSQQSKLWANFGTDGDAATAQNNAKEYARQASNFASAAKTSAVNAALSETNAAQSEDIADQHMRDAQSAKIAAETAQGKAELAMSHYPRINNNDNWETWSAEEEEWQDTGHKSIAQADIEYSYQNSTRGTVPPTGEWANEPQPQTGKFLWMRMKYTWTNGRTDYFYNVSYIGANGTGSVNSVNGLGGDIILDGTNIYIDDNAQTKETVYNAIARLGTSITETEIDALFNVD